MIDLLARHNQGVAWLHRVDIEKGKRPFVLVYLVAGNLPIDNLSKYTRFHTLTIPYEKESPFHMVYNQCMPIRNTIKEYDAPAYYHIYNRGAGRHTIFKDNEDNQKFLSLLSRYLGHEKPSNAHGYKYTTYDLELLAYCLMGNHFHLFVYQPSDERTISKYMQSVLTAYTMYFNRKYHTEGRLFQSVFKASRITSEAHFDHITRYIHMNPKKYAHYQWSSLSAYLGSPCPPWLTPGRVMTMSPESYLRFLDGYKQRRDDLKRLLADQ